MPDTLSSLIALLPRTVDALIQYDGQAFYTWQSENLQSGGDSRAGSAMRDRYERLQEASEDGCDGQTHGEHIDDLREYAEVAGDTLNRRASRIIETDEEQEAWDAAFAAAGKALGADLDSLYEWHKQNGSLDQTT